MLTNLEIFKFCQKYPEPILDEFYKKNVTLIIAKDPHNPTLLMIKNIELIECLNALSLAGKKKNQAMKKLALEEMRTLLIENSDLNYSEFVSFWSVLDISYSFFVGGIKTIEEQKRVLEILAEQYLLFRHSIYSLYGYSPVTLQVWKDAKSHKSSGQLGLLKVSKILEDLGFSDANQDSLQEFEKWDKKYITTDQQGKQLFKEILEKHRIRFLWKSEKDEKMPDFLVRIGEHIFIIEHKHTKEWWWGQDKQVNELVSFIQYSEVEDTIHFVSFLDGVYFNKWIDRDIKKGKVLNQLNNIEDNLIRYRNNYFVNTEWFKKLFSDR